MPIAEYAAFDALDPFFQVVQKGLKEFVDGEHYRHPGRRRMVRVPIQISWLAADRSRALRSHGAVVRLWQQH